MYCDQPTETVDSFRFDEQGAGRELASHLAGNGHRRVAFMTPSLDYPNMAWLHRGFTQAVEDGVLEGRRREVRRLLDGCPRPDGQPDPSWPPAPPGWRLWVTAWPNSMVWSFLSLVASGYVLYSIVYEEMHRRDPAVYTYVLVALLLTAAGFSLYGAVKRHRWSELVPGLISLAALLMVVVRLSVQ